MHFTRDFARADLRIPLSSLVAMGGAAASWYELSQTADRRTAWKQQQQQHTNNRLHAKHRGNVLGATGITASVDAPKGTSGPRADNNCSQIRLRIKITRL